MKTMYGGLFIFIGIILLLLNLGSNVMSSLPGQPLDLAVVLFSIVLIILGIYMFREDPKDDE